MDQQADSFHREEYRKSMDTLLVYNPTDEDYICFWDKYPHVIPNRNKDMGFGKGNMQLVRYIAKKYMDEMKDKLIIQMADKMLEQEKQARTNKGLSNDPYEVNAAIANVAPKTNNEKEIEKVYEQLYKGVVREFGLYDAPVKEDMLKPDQRTPEEKAFEKISNKTKEIPQAQNSVIIEPDDLTSDTKTEDITPNGIKVVYTKETAPKKSRIINDEE
jgi:hypothetical protein